MLSANHGHHTYAARLFVTVPRERNRMKPLFPVPPTKRWQIHTMSVEPCSFPRHVTVKPLLHIASPSAIKVRSLATTTPRRRRQPERKPRAAGFRMLENTTKSTNCSKCGREATIIGAKLVLMRLSGRSMPEAPPTFTRRMSNDRKGTSIGSCIARLVPRLYVREAKIDAIGFDEQGGNHQYGSPSGNTMASHGIHPDAKVS